jgi:cell fate regulator YaaT (PSP1 superfamily)
MYKVVGVSFNETSRIYYFDVGNFELKKGDNVIVETEKGLQFGTVLTNIKEVSGKDILLPLKPILRLATASDIERRKENSIEEKKAMETAKRIVKNLNLDMRILSASYNFDRKQLLFNFLADERIDFRELAKELAKIYRTRIELRQIGVRDKAKEIGGLGPCGRFLCCNSFLTDLNSVTINMAKNQYIALNPTKINGACGRLLCCLGYEDDFYTEAKKNLPDIGDYITKNDLKGKVVSINVFNNSYKLETDNNEIVEVVVQKS